jgi:hypothetical protein
MDGATVTPWGLCYDEHRELCAGRVVIAEQTEAVGGGFEERAVVNTRAFLVVGWFVLWAADFASAQMFSHFQTVDANPSLRNAGGLTGDRRFLRSNRRRDDFIGRDISAGQGFVGEARGRTEGRVPPATLTLQEEPAVNVNTPLPAPPRSGLYPPRLSIGFDVTAPAEASPSQSLQALLTRALGLGPTAPIEVAVSGRTVTLRGAVPSARERELAALLVAFEPGVELVRNELQVRAPSRRPRPPQPPDDSRPQESSGDLSL